MKTRLTIKQMVKAILFDATAGRRTADNYLEGMTVIDSMQTFFYRAYFENLYQRWADGKMDARRIVLEWYASLHGRGRLGDNRAAIVADAINTLLWR